LSTKVIVSVSENCNRPRLALLPPKKPPPPPPPRPPPKPPPPRRPSDGGAGRGDAPSGAGLGGIAPCARTCVPRPPKPNCDRSWSITACDGRRDLSGLEKSNP